jgi:hypothetical protein
MNIDSLQTLIDKYFKNTGITPPNNPAAAPAAPAPGTGSTASGDTVTLSQQALDYQKAHTLPDGKFMPPNVFADLLTAMDGPTDQNAEQTDALAQPNLLDFLNSKSNPSDFASGSSTTPDSSNPFDSLSGFLG